MPGPQKRRRDLSPERVARAIAHLLEVAAAYDNDPSAEDRGARAMLAKVCAAVESHARSTTARRDRVATAALVRTAIRAFEMVRQRERSARREARSKQPGLAGPELRDDEAAALARSIAPYIGAEHADGFIERVKTALAEGSGENDGSARPHRAAQVVAEFQGISLRAVHHQVANDRADKLPSAFRTAIPSSGRIEYVLRALGWPRDLAARLGVQARRLRDL